MKTIFGLIFVLTFSFYSCSEDNKTTEQQVLDTDTVGVEYEVEQKVQETTVDVDTTTKTETVEKEHSNH